MLSSICGEKSHLQNRTYIRIMVLTKLAKEEPMSDRTYMCLDLKSAYASIECRERGLDPMTTNLVVADPERSDKTICLAVSPAMKKLGVPGRCRVFEIPKHIEYIMAPPRMQLYIDYAADIYAIYLRYIAKEDIHVYSIDECFFDVTDYLEMYDLTAAGLAMKIMKEVYQETGITATCGIGTNLYLAKIALDIMAKHVKDNIGILDQKSYRKRLWRHTPLTDFWRIGPGIARQLERFGITTMEGIAKADEEILYRQFGIDAELLIDHAWGREPTTMADIKKYQPKTSSISSGQVLGCDSDYERGRLIVKEMVDLMCLELVEKVLVTDSITLHIGYNKHYNKKSAHGTAGMRITTSSAKQIIACALELYEQIVDRHIPLHRFNVIFNNVVDKAYQQYDLFTDPRELEREYQIQKAMLNIKRKYGKNAILKGMNLLEGAMTKERNGQIGGHKSGI